MKKWTKIWWWRILVVFGIVVAMQFLMMSIMKDFNMLPRRAVIENPNCEAWFASDGSGASLECPEIGVAVVARGKACNYVLQNYQEVIIRCSNINIQGTIK